MILDHMDGQMGDPSNHMMDWGPNTWLYMILGFLVFLLIVIVLIYILNRGGQHVVEKQPSLQPQDNKDFKGKDRAKDYKQKENQFCFYCGATLDDIGLKFCPKCGNELKTDKS